MIKERVIEIINDKQFRYLFLASLISAEVLVTKEACEKSLEVLTFIKDNADNFYTGNKDELFKLVNEGLEIVNRDIKQFN